ncbi:hypothetical protein F9K33_11745 [bacterium]|nr:MAG: hypothetical protein F9K33_11745 [bacterium]
MRVVTPLLLLALISAPLKAQSIQDSLKEVNRKIDILTEEIERLKLGKVAEIKYASSRGLGPAAAKVYQVDQGVSIAGYGELVYENYSRKRDDKSMSSSQDQFDYLRNILYFGYRFSDRILFNSEIEFEHGYTGKQRGGKPIGEVGMEFGYIELMFNKHANLRAGMVLIPVGIINEKHEPSTFFGTLRPQVEQRIIPTTWRGNGIGLYGEIFSGLEYRAYVVEGLDATNFTAKDGIRDGRQLGSKAYVEHFALTAKFEYSGVRGLIFGTSFYSGNANQTIVDSLKGWEPNVTILSAHAEWSWKGLETRALYVQNNLTGTKLFNQEFGKTIGKTMKGWYVAAGYDVMPLIKAGTAHYLAPYIQYESFDTQADVASGLSRDPESERMITTVGISYKPHPNVAFKFDFRNNANEKKTGNDQWNLAINYLF